MTAHATHNRSLAISLVMLVAGMVMLSFASVPLYRLFCQVTGFGGTTARAEYVPKTVLARRMNLHFNTDVAPGLPLEFKTPGHDVTFKIGEPQLVDFHVTNTSDQPVHGTAVFNVTPHKGGKYFVKLACFCFEEQVFAPGETRALPVSFYVDPAIADDDIMDDVTHMTLSYTFFNPDKVNR